MSPNNLEKRSRIPEKLQIFPTVRKPVTTVNLLLVTYLVQDTPPQNPIPNLGRLVGNEISSKSGVLART